MKILIVRLSALGDIVHALPVLAAIKKAMPGAEVDWLVEENYASILSLATGLRRRIIVRARNSFATPEAISFGGWSGYHAAAKYLWNQDYDIALDLQGLIKSAIWARISFADRVVGFDEANLREPQAAFLYSETVTPQDRPTGQHRRRQATGRQQAIRPARHPQKSFDSVGAADQAGCHRGAAGAAGIGLTRPRRLRPPAGRADSSCSIPVRRGRTSAGPRKGLARWPRRCAIAWACGRSLPGDHPSARSPTPSRARRLAPRLPRRRRPFRISPC